MVTCTRLCGNVPLGAPDLHGALLHMREGALLAAGQIGIGPGQRGQLVEGLLLARILQRHNGRPKLQAVIHLQAPRIHKQACRPPGARGSLTS